MLWGSRVHQKFFASVGNVFGILACFVGRVLAFVLHMGAGKSPPSLPSFVLPPGHPPRTSHPIAADYDSRTCCSRGWKAGKGA